MSTLDSFRLDGKVAMVVGGARDLGYDMADALAEAGADLVITSRTLASAAGGAAKLKAARGVEVLPLALDVTSHAQVAAVVRQAAAWKGRIDVLINNAGGTPTDRGPAALLERSPEAMVELITVNLLGALYCCQEVGRVMAKQKSGSIINIGSIAGLVGRDRRMYARNQMNGQPIDYAAAKAGVIGMTLDLSAYFGPMGVRVNCISPGGFRRQLPEGFARDYSDRTALGRMGRDGVDLKGAALFLASAASDYVTGHNLVVDGGFVPWH